MSSVAIIVAAGSGERLRAGMPKALVELCGKTLLQWSLDALIATPGVGEIIVALPEGVAAPAGAIGVRGGLTRSESVQAALAAASASQLVLVHDAARPLLTVTLAQAVLEVAAEAELAGAVAAAPVTDTIKRVVPMTGTLKRMVPVTGTLKRATSAADTIKRAAAGIVDETLPRSELWAVQTPQAFKAAALRRALDAPIEVLRQATDDASLIEREGGKIAIVPANAENLKVTTPLDLELAALLLRRRAEAAASAAKA